MTRPDRWHHVEQIYHDALARGEGERSAFLRAACGSDDALRREVESLLAYASDARQFMNAPAIQIAADAFGRSEPISTPLAGRRLGPYEIGSLLGSGGMGEVYRARDTKLGRDVAIKILPRAFIEDSDRRARFEREARLLAALNHPHIGAIYGFEERDGIHALVLELVEGETLAERLARSQDRALPIDEALAIARQIADALEAAHEKGIIHRDLKPANIAITPDGVAKVLDFGLAKAGWAGAAGEAGGGDDLTHSPTVTIGATRDGLMLGTAPYMSPEQARGKIVDKRTDIWAFGCVLYEMLTGRKAFGGHTVSDTIAAILEREPDWSLLPQRTPSAIRRLLLRCVEKDPKRRLHDIADARIEIDDTLAAPAPRDAPPRSTRARVWQWTPWVIGAAGAAALAASAASFRGLWRTSNPPPTYHQVTFRRGAVSGAHFALDGRTIVYSAAWEGAPVALFSTRVDSPESSGLPLASATVLSISSSGRMAIRLSDAQGRPGIGTLAEVPLSGRAPRELLTDVTDADWAPDGETLVVSHVVQGRTRLEYPAGTLLYEQEPGRLIRSPRFSPKGGVIGFADFAGTDFGGTSRIVVVDLTGHVKVLSQGWGDVFGLAWAPGGDEIWFSAREAAARSGGLVVHAVTLSGQHRVVARTPGNLIVQEIWRDGRVLLRHDNWPATLMCQAPGAANERDLSWLDFSRARDISADGRYVLFLEDGYAGGSKSGVYLRKTDGSPAIRLGDGRAVTLSPDGASAIAIDRESPSQLTILPTGPGQARVVRGEGLTYLSASWFPDSVRLLCGAQEPGRPPALYLQNVAGGAPRRLVDGADRGDVSPDGRTVATISPEGSLLLTPVNGGSTRVVRGIPSGSSLLRWAATGRHLFLRGALFDKPAKIFRFDIETGRADLWRTLGPSDLSGVTGALEISLTPDGRSYCYSYIRVLSSVVVVDGLK